MMQAGWAVIAGSAGLGWAVATMRRLRTGDPLFPGEALQAKAMLIVSACVSATGLIRIF